MPPRLHVSDRPIRRIAPKTHGKSAFSLTDTLAVREGAMPVTRRGAVGAPTTWRATEAPADLMRSPAGLLNDAIDAANVSIDAIELQVPLVANAIRWSGDGVSGPKLDVLVRHAKRLVLLAALAAEVSGLNLRELRRRDPRIADTIDDTCDALDMLMLHQEAGDSLGVADTLTEHVATALSGWRVVFSAIAAEVRCAA